ncbi:MAG: leucine--tRNA ligase [Lewinellaceae bacterium]|nr:leucine--tRNA ligase [Lewinellaceae bacterium]
MEYNPREIEKKWKKYWDEHQVYQVTHQSDKPKYYVLDMFPYPSGAGLHVGHPLGYIASDIYARFMRHKGYNVLHPMGYDAFGLPAEQYAIQTGIHPATATTENIARYRAQLENIGFSYDWSRELKTCDPDYYRWTQWIFLQLFEHYYDQDADKAVPISELVARFERSGSFGVHAACTQPSAFSATEWKAMSPKAKDDVLMNYRLAYRQVTYVNWCEALGTVLANDEVKDGVSERGGHPVERKPMLQWLLRITAYAERLLRDLDTLEWSDSMKKMQSNWIGRSEGAQLFFPIEGSDKKLEIFTTRADTIFGATFMVLAPEHDWVKELTTTDNAESVNAYLKYTNARSDRERMAEKEITGVALGSHAINPFNGERIPIWISEYVLKDYGTGAIMAVPSDDDRDYKFAQYFGLPIVEIIDKSAFPDATRQDKVGVMINSDFLTGMQVPQAIEATLKRIEEMGIGKRQINYKLRDAIYSRQRYWGEPFPIIYDPEGVAHAMKVEDLPLELPELEDFQPSGGGKSPLARHEEWVDLPNGWRRETDTMPGFAGSSWYFLRYMDPHNDQAFASQDAINYWKDVDLYIGGTEHAVGHLMYARFWNKFLYDKGLVPVVEPFRKLVNQGMIQGVIEYLYLQKEKVDGASRFVSAELVEDHGDGFAKIPIHVEFVEDYGSPNSFINKKGIEQFIEWRPEFRNAIFECSQGVYQNGVFTSKNGGKDSRMVTVSEVGKMSKRYFNVINPDDVVEEYGADCFRLYEMFLGPLEQAKPWDTKGIDGVSKFLRKFWSLFFNEKGEWIVTDEAPSREELKTLHQCIKKIHDDLERFSLNTCVSGFMIATNELRRLNTSKRAILEPMTVLLAPFAPHLSEELWHRLGNSTTVVKAAFPQWSEEYLREDSVTYPVSINGKKRATVDLPVGMPVPEIETAALEMPEVKKWLEGLTVRKTIVVPGRMINIVAN